jgi:helicase SWR1
MHGYRYLRLDGSTKVEDRQALMDRFNNDKRIFVFILSTRSGGIGMNLTGADAVIFYDSDWNPAMDGIFSGLLILAQAQDRAHRIGQTRDVHIYRLVSSHTIEENMLKKTQKKRALDDFVIRKGDFTTTFIKKTNWKDWIEEGMEKEDVLNRVEDEEDVLALRKMRQEMRQDDREFEETVEKEESEDRERDIEDYMFEYELKELGLDDLFPLADFE